MSRIYWHSPSGDAILHGSERHHLGHVARGPASVAWDLDRGAGSFDRAIELMAILAPGHDHYIQEYLEKALAQEKVNHKGDLQTNFLAGTNDYESERVFMKGLQLNLQVDGLELEVAGVRLHTRDIELNTALATGDDVIALAAKIHGWCENHCYIEGIDRAWVALIIEEGLNIGVFRRGLWHTKDWKRLPWERRARGPEDQWVKQGWEDVVTLLRSRDDEPVVLSYSVTEYFPNEDVAGLTRKDEKDESWYELPKSEQWELALAGIRKDQPWAQISPDKLHNSTFYLNVTVYDLFAEDRDERVQREVDKAAAKKLRTEA